MGKKSEAAELSRVTEEYFSDDESSSFVNKYDDDQRTQQVKSNLVKRAHQVKEDSVIQQSVAQSRGTDENCSNDNSLINLDEIAWPDQAFT